MRTYLIIKSAASWQDRLTNNVVLGTQLALGNNGVEPKLDEHGTEIGHSPRLNTLKSRGRQALAAGGIGLGTIGGTLGGYYLGRGISDALDLSTSDSALARALGYGLRGAGAFGGGTAGYIGSSALASYLAGDNKAKTDSALEALARRGSAKTQDEKDKAITDYNDIVGAQITPW